MSSEWREVTIEEIADVKSGKRLPKGHSLVSNNTQLPYIRLVDVSDGVIRKSGIQYLLPETQKKISRYIVNEHDVCLAIVGHTIGMVFFIDKDFDKVNLTENAARITNFKEGINSKFLYYYLTSSIGQQEILARKVGSAQGKLPMYNIKSLPINLPPLPEQKAIANILGKLDDKIELNRQMNQSLEQMAQALFQSWFVDFDPVIDNALAAGNQIPEALAQKAENRRTVIARNDEGETRQSLPKAIQNLFPNNFVFNDTLNKWIPEGWEVKSLYESAEFVNGAAFKPEFFTDKNEGYPIIKIVELKSGISDQTKYTTQKMADKYFITEGDLLYSWSGSPDTSLNAFLWSGEDGWLNQHVFNVITLDACHKAYMFNLLMQLKPTLIAIAKDKQTTGLGHVTVKDMKKIFIARPSHSFNKILERSILPLFEKSFSIQLQVKTLTKLRDTLLPKLISGEVSVGDAMINPLNKA